MWISLNPELLMCFFPFFKVPVNILFVNKDSNIYFVIDYHNLKVSFDLLWFDLLHVIFEIYASLENFPEKHSKQKMKKKPLVTNFCIICDVP